jgi:hypothetical protein
MFLTSAYRHGNKRRQAMKNYLNELVRRHRRLNRQIDNRKAAGWQVDMKQLKRLRLRIKDEIQAIRKRLQQSPS